MANRIPFRPKKSLGQHFLHDPNIIRKIADALRAPENAPVVEIGPGMGALTEELLRRYPSLTAIEIDERAVAQLRQRFSGLDLHLQDILEVDWSTLAREKGEPLYVIGNLPYQITSPLLFELLSAKAHLEEAVLMMQKEVAERLVAKPRTKAYGIPSVLVQLWAEPELLFDVSRHVFYPKPEVTSAVVRLTFREETSDGEDDSSALREVVRAAFNQRRKMLRNSLSQWTKEQGIELPHDWGRKRAEALSPEEFAELARYLSTREEEG